MVNQEIAIAISAAFFGIVVGFLAGYPVTCADDYQPAKIRTGLPSDNLDLTGSADRVTSPSVIVSMG